MLVLCDLRAVTRKERPKEMAKPICLYIGLKKGSNCGKMIKLCGEAK